MPVGCALGYHVRDDARRTIGSFVIARSDGSAPSPAFAEKNRITEHVFNQAANTLDGNLARWNELPASQGCQVRRVVFALGMRWNDCARDA